MKEYISLTEAYNEMLLQVKDLKLENYEKQLAIQKSHLQYLQLQIKPHFYLNALNILFSLAELKDYETIQKLTLSLVEYSRYMFRDATTLVRLEEELNHIRNYVQIQKIRFMDAIEYVEDVEGGLENVLVPPFLLQSFVENSVKYGMRYRETSVISLKISVYGQGFIEIIIRDNGDGLAPELLDKLSRDEEIDGGKDKHIGIRNARERLRIIFGDRAELKLENENGAVVRIYIPYE